MTNITTNITPIIWTGAGVPLIGIAASYGLALAVREAGDRDGL